MGTEATTAGVDAVGIAAAVVWEAVELVGTGAADSFLRMFANSCLSSCEQLDWKGKKIKFLKIFWKKN